ncbi:disintegrin and metalloproteinase domain-containing protein 9-like isoform X2 [Lineus longissimus]|uniref:disintegrin and metalloproteinase domain-containing protein 9-like isoform X2 n=1 Tax=Lineus longissimus TaxID=88925 RepID=UPI002B4F5704
MLFIKLLFLQCLLSCIRGLQEDKSREEFHTYDVTVPYIRGLRYRRDTGTLLHNGHMKKTELAFTAFNRKIVVDLHLNSELISEKYIEKHFEGEREVIHRPRDHSYTHCYYHGRVHGIPESIVALSTCDGVSGMVDTGHEIYYIHPMNESSHGKHYVFREVDRKETNSSCGVEDHGSPHMAHQMGREVHNHIRMKRSIHGPYDSNSKSRYVELYIVNDLRQYDNFKRDKYAVIARTKEVINIVNALYRPLNIYIALVGVEIWTSTDRIYVVENAEKTMNNFLKYRKDYINPYHKNDNAQLLTGAVFNDGVVGKAVKGPICTYQYSGGVNMDHSPVVTVVAITVAHEMGHNFGMEHDRGTCICAAQRCIMAASSGGMNPIRWSSCSKQYLADAFEAGMDYCLMEKPTRIYDGPICGNSFVEPGEECDCGLEEECESVCCNPATCKLFSNATCATGSCCDQTKCQYKKASTMCRPRTSECDLPEYCLGSSEYCPEDVFVQNGHSCNYKRSYCFNGSCNSHDSQCQKLWGRTAKNSDSLCYTMLNPDANANGNCGFHWINMSFTKCAAKDVNCGMLHCVHLNEKLEFWKEANTYLMPETFITSAQGKKIPCKSAIMDVGFDMPDPGMVPSGSKCSDGKMCLNHQCQWITDLKFPKCYMGCSDNGVCNSKGNCHCDAGWASPLCDRAGSGGSIDSGPAGDYDEPQKQDPGKQNNSRGNNTLSDNGEMSQSDKSLMISLLIIFLVILPLIVTLVAFSYKYRKFLIQMWRRRTYMAKPFQKASVVIRRSDSSASNSAGRQNVKRTASLPRGSLPRDISAPVFQSTTMKAANDKMMDIPNPEIRTGGNRGNGPLISHPLQPPARPAPDVPSIDSTSVHFSNRPVGLSRPIPQTRINNNVQPDTIDENRMYENEFIKNTTPSSIHRNEPDGTVTSSKPTPVRATFGNSSAATKPPNSAVNSPLKPNNNVKGETPGGKTSGNSNIRPGQARGPLGALTTDSAAPSRVAPGKPGSAGRGASRGGAGRGTSGRGGSTAAGSNPVTGRGATPNRGGGVTGQGGTGANRGAAAASRGGSGRGTTGAGRGTTGAGRGSSRPGTAGSRGPGSAGSAANKPGGGSKVTQLASRFKDQDNASNNRPNLPAKPRGGRGNVC